MCSVYFELHFASIQFSLFDPINRSDLSTLGRHVEILNLKCLHVDSVSEWVSSFLTAHQHKIGHSVSKAFILCDIKKDKTW